MSKNPIAHYQGDDTLNFWKAVKVWLNNPHVVNRRILTSTKLFSVRLNPAFKSLSMLAWTKKVESVIQLHRKNLSPSLTESLHALELQENIDISNDFELNDPLDNECYICLQKLFPRNAEIFSNSLELAVIDKGAGRISFFSGLLDNTKQSLSMKWPYRIEYESNSSQVLMYVEKEENTEKDPNITWLQEQFFPRFVKWMGVNRTENGLMSGSLNLVPVEKYAVLYHALKNKYGAEMVKIWPENTDPAKFVYEDVAIATYLLLIWELERDLKATVQKQSFVDLGCGNGLLVHILASEGHPGLGIDLRKRNIWDLYPRSTHLEVRTIVPSNLNLFPETDWLIGNHSDELTPWIPVIAARSSYQCRFFLLPCCAYEFDGRKYQRDSAAKSQYFEYMNYIKKVCEECGFKTDMDKLRIPSTKRICFIGRERYHTEAAINAQEAAIESLINARSIKKREDPAVHDSWSPAFKPREVTERVRNCTKVDRGLISDIVNMVADHLLHKVRMIDVGTSVRRWNAGGQLKLSQVAELLPQKTLKELKSECGGLQTLLRNNGDIFQVIQGKVQFRIPGSSTVIGRKKKRQKDSKSTKKSKLCWFHQNHPDGCPLNAETCNYKH
ncbi:probable tRNA (uracil-O(2)-)-methyltransferase [Athalia rosae]|uniref:probable tRNA (uracil-O(2)-)-methyltransferase n=1 Tax=Athalia rosae TaxID=37344 RepID=UPI002033E3CD|nr:probable tRNA (uracil-O(2)-)-methyltransferase [Athalia rosae]